VLLPEGVSHLVLEQAGEATKRKARGRSHGDDHGLALTLSLSDFCTTAASRGGRDDDDAARTSDAVRLEPPLEEGRQVARVVTGAVVEEKAGALVELAGFALTRGALRSASRD
jgi:hypothetical protein